MRRRDDKFPENGFEAWGGYMQAKIAKLEEQFSNKAGQEENTLSNIFNGVSIYVNGYTVPSADELKLLMARHGGVYHTYQKPDDYIIASNLPDTKVKNMSLAKVVKPEWITDSIASNHLLNYRDYLLYKCSRTQTTLKFNKVNDSVNVKNKFNNNLNIVNDINYKDNNNLNQNESSSCNDLKCTSIKSPKNLNVIGNLQQNKKEIKEQVMKTAADPDFISEFYNNSRLHHISQLGANFKQYINDLRENSNFIFVARSKLKEKVQALNTPYNLSQITFRGGKTIMHIDMDCFFVSVGLRSRPELRGKPVAVTHSKGGHGRAKRPGVDRLTELNLYKQKQVKALEKIGIANNNIKIETRVDSITEDEEFGSMSEIASCSYAARAKGVGNGMFMGAALRLCPDLKTIPYDFEGYKEVAYILYNTIAQYTLDIEAVSCDEMYVDCTDLLTEINISVQDFATVIRNEIKEKTGCPCSTGFGGNRLQARLATKRAKPDGQFFLTAELIDDFMIDIKLKDLPGVGRQITQKLESLGHHTCGSLQSLSIASLQHHLGNKTGSQLYDQCRGRDTNPLTFHTVRKSVSAEVNYGIRFENDDQCVEFLKRLSAEVHSRMQQFKVLGKCITLKLMVRAEEAPIETAKFMGHGFCNVINKSASLTCATNDVHVITKEVITLSKKLKIDPKELRGIGIQVTKLEPMNCKQAKGTISKYLLNKPIKQENKLEHEPCFNFPVQPDLKNNNGIKTNETLKPPTTPKKSKNISPKKSPIIGSLKSPTGKRRGRPLKNTSIRSHQTSSKNLMNKFLHGQTVKDTPYKNPIISAPIVAKEPLKKEKSQGLLGLPWQKVRELLRAWLVSGQTPLPYDINLITEYTREMVITKNIDKLNILLNFLRRRTSELNRKDWEDVYTHIVENVQNAMTAVYGKKLYIGD